jgi:hypothetical protein
MPRKTKSQTRLEEIRHPALVALSKIRIGPIFPNPEELKDVPKGMRGQERKKTVFPFDDAYREKRKRRKRIASWSRNGRTFRYSTRRSRNLPDKADRQRAVEAS